MRKKVSVLAVCIISLISVLMIPAVLAEKPTFVEGILYYTPYVIPPPRFSGANVILETWEEGTWTGDIEGESHDEPCRVVIHDAVGGFPPSDWKFRWYTSIATLDVCTVDGREGGLVMRLVGKDDGLPDDGPPQWNGKWVIIEGTGELAGIHGQGTWWGPGWLGGPEQGVIPYEGWVHFDPS